MGYYVYQYLHPEYGHLYCGRTNDLDKRIYEHNNCENDNIPREYEELLKESIIMYIKLKNKAQGIAVEAYCIDKYKPYLNKALKYLKHDDDDCDNSFILEMKLPKWKIYNPKKSKYKHQLSVIKEEELQIVGDISNAKKILKQKKDELSKTKFELEKINYNIKIQENIKDKNNDVLFGFGADDIKWFYKHCENKNVKFYSEIYDKVGNISANGCIYYDFGKDEVVLEVYSGREGKPYTITDKEIFFDINACMLYNFYPDINIYPELYVSLLCKKNELLIINNIHDLKDLINNSNYDGRIIHNADKESSVSIEFENGEIVYCCVKLDSYNHVYKGTHNLLKGDDKINYIWYKKDGVLLIEEKHHIYKKEDIDIGIKDYIFSCKYHHPDRNEKEEEYCDKMLSKFNA